MKLPPAGTGFYASMMKFCTNQKHTKEHFDQILDDVTRYEKFCAEHPEYENNKAVMAIENIKRVYQKCSNDNTFL